MIGKGYFGLFKAQQKRQIVILFKKELQLMLCEIQ